MVTIYINNIQLKVKKNTTIFQACNILNIEIPRFCFQDYLNIAGNCRMCLVELENLPKPVASCAMPVAENMKIFTDTPLVKKARESVLEFLLLNHPLDCPICDQGGECDLQDQSYYFGSDRSRFFFFKRGVEDKNVGPFIKTIMTRCIHCTRCVRFANDICGIDHLGTTGRGSKTEIGFYLNKIFSSEFSGNVIDLCPVGALTSKPYAFKARPWELQKINTIDILDGIGSNIQVQTLRNEVIRIIPQTNNSINLEWITNKTRFFFDSIKYQRIQYPLYKNKNNIFEQISWYKVFYILYLQLKKKNFSIELIIGDFIDLKSIFFFKKFINNLGSSNIFYEKNMNFINSEISSNFLFNNNFEKIKNNDLCLLINCNPRLEGSILNLYLKNSFQKNSFEIFNIGPKIELTYPINHLSLSLKTFNDIIKGKHFLCKKLRKSKNPILIFGNNFLKKKENYFLILNLKKIINFKKKETINFFQIQSSFLNFLEINLINYKKQFSNFLYLLNTDSSLKKKKKENYFIIYQGHHFTEDAQNSNLILPSLTFLEKKGIYLNVQGFIQKTQKILKLKIEQKSDIKIIKNLLNFLINSKKKEFNFIDIFPYIEKKKIKKLNFNIKYFKKNFNINNSYLKYSEKKYYGVNILEKYSKTLMNSIHFFKQSSHF